MEMWANPAAAPKIISTSSVGFPPRKIPTIPRMIVKGKIPRQQTRARPSADRALALGLFFRGRGPFFKHFRLWRTGGGGGKRYLTGIHTSGSWASSVGTRATIEVHPFFSKYYPSIWEVKKKTRLRHVLLNPKKRLWKKNTTIKPAFIADDIADEQSHGQGIQRESRKKKKGRNSDNFGSRSPVIQKLSSPKEGIPLS